MNAFKLSFLSLFMLFAFSCDNDNDTPVQQLGNNDPTTVNQFTVNNQSYNTPNGYLILDDGPSYTNAFMLGFLDGILREDNVNGSSITTSTTNALVLQVDFGGPNVSSEATVTNQITNGSVFNLTDESTALPNITSYQDTYIENGIEYGEPDSTNLAYEVGANGGGTVKINQFMVDLANRTGTIDCEYSFLDNNGVQVSGQYSGTFDIINEF